MIKMTENTLVKDNTITINGISFLVDDKLAEQIYLTVKEHGDFQTSKIATPKQTYIAEKTEYHSIGKKPFACKFEIKEQTATDGTKLFCISRKNGWTKAEKQSMNNAIKSLKNIKTITVAYTDKNGKSREYSAWGYTTESTAKKHLAELPTTIDVEYFER